MTLNFRTRVSAVVLMTGATLAVAAPAWAAVPAQIDPTPPAKLTELKARADEVVKDRVVQIDKLSGRVQAAAADCGQNADVVSQLASDRTGLQALDATIQAETDPAKAVAEFHQIFTDFRIYWLETPKTNEVVACDRESKAGSTLTSVRQKIQARVDEAKAKGLDVSKAQAALDDMGAKLGEASTQSHQASSSVVGLHADKGDKAVLQSNIAALAQGRQELKGAWTDLQAARKDARTAIAALKELAKP